MIMPIRVLFKEVSVTEELLASQAAQRLLLLDSHLDRPVDWASFDCGSSHYADSVRRHGGTGRRGVYSWQLPVSGVVQRPSCGS